MANSRLCSIPNCGNKHKGHGLCNKHHLRFRKYGDPLAVVGERAGKGDLEKFYQNVVLPYDGNDCLIWPYGDNGVGYGTMRKDGVRGYVHRFLCEDVNGPPPTPEHEAAHSCGKGHLRCVTKGHLSWKTPKNNNQDKILHGTSMRGEKHNRSKLTEAQVREIISLKGEEAQRSIAKRYNVCFQTISLIHTGKVWAWIDRS